MRQDVILPYCDLGSRCDQAIQNPFLRCQYRGFSWCIVGYYWLINVLVAAAVAVAAAVVLEVVLEVVVVVVVVISVKGLLSHSS